MILATEIKRILFRFPKRTILTISIAAALLCCFIGYLGNMQSGENALIHLGQAVPVTVQIASRNGRNTQRLEIRQKTFQGIMALGIRDAQYTAGARISMAPDGFIPENGMLGDSLLAVNNLTVLENPDANAFYENVEVPFWEEGQAVCFLQDDYAARQNLSVGDMYRPYIYSPRYNSDGFSLYYENLGQKSLKIVGTIPDDMVSGEVIVPVTWLWQAEEDAGIEPVCSSFQGIVEDPLHLNDFKKNLPACGLGPVAVDANEESVGNALLVHDRQYIEKAEQLIQNNRILKSFLPFFSLTLIMITMIVTFFLMRSVRRDMALAMALGQPRIRCALPYFCSILIADLTGGLVVFVPVWCITNISPLRFLGVYGMFYGCAAVGVAAALLLVFRFDPLTLLSASE